MSPYRRQRSLVPLLAVTLLASALPFVAAQAPKPAATCGKAKIYLANPIYLTSALGIVAVELPQSWALDTIRKNPFYFLKTGDRYENARTLMYVNIERLEVPFQDAVQRDVRSFAEGCQPTTVEDAAQLDILEQGCERKTQMFLCERKQGAYVDLTTKISVGGLLLNVVLSADNRTEISRYKKDYEFLLKHLALVTP